MKDLDFLTFVEIQFKVMLDNEAGRGPVVNYNKASVKASAELRCARHFLTFYRFFTSWLPKNSSPTQLPHCGLEYYSSLLTGS